ncbi:unnamed protein product [Linum tenue]|uniref:Pentatricopeptide repeat-containing protein n=3 Tax=Linum tenue TaxID=586396 RepID=A0AAV0QT39_9ROSI|nr:unnamed protein product [Linum tenue]
MRKNMLTILAQPLFLYRIPVLPIKKQNSVTSIPVGTPWIMPLFACITEVLSNYKQVSTQISPEDEEFRDENWYQILNAIENAPMSAREICSSQISKLCESGNLSAAARLLQFLRERNIFTAPNLYNTLMEVAGRRNDVEILCQVFKDLILYCKSLPSTSYLTLARAFSRINEPLCLLQLTTEISELKYPSNTVVLNRLISAFAECGQSDKALMIFYKIKSLKCEPDLVTYNTIMDMLGRAGQTDEMLNKFASLKDAGIIPDFVSFNTILNHLRRKGRLDLCLVCLKDMSAIGIQPDLLTYTALISSFGQSGNIEEALRLFNEMKTRQIRPSVYVYRSLVNCLKKMGKLELAMTILEEMNASTGNLAGPKEFKWKGR